MECTTPATGEPTATAHWAPTGPLAIDTVASQWTALQAQLASGLAVAIDLTGATRVDTAGVQMLVQAQRAAAAAGRPLQVHGLALAPDTCRLLGIPMAAVAVDDIPVLAAGQEG